VTIGVHLPDLTYPGGAATMGEELARTAAAADEAGIDRLSVMDHVWQIPNVGPVDHEMLEAYTTLGFLAAHSSRVKLLALVTGVTYRSPGLLVKAVTTLDVLSGGRAMLGIGAAWNEDESRGLGLFFPPRAERFERLEEALQICLQMWSGSDAPYEGTHYQLGRTLTVPQPLTRPHPPILIGGGGEQKTLRLVAKYAQSSNLFAGPELEHKLQVLREHCEREGRPYEDIEKTALLGLDPGPDGEDVDGVLERLRHAADLGIQVGHGRVLPDRQADRIRVLGEKVVPVVAEW
jgi:F420-dependent oxidoreductase-like protein